MVLEFSKPEAPLISDLYDFYSFKILPKLGKFFAQDEESYQYLAESIRMHPSQEEFKQMLESVNFKNVSYDIMTAGIVTFTLRKSKMAIFSLIRISYIFCKYRLDELLDPLANKVFYLFYFFSQNLLQKKRNRVSFKRCLRGDGSALY